MLSSGKTVGLFQIESAGMREALLQMKPNHIEDIIALVALYRPGPMESIPKYIENKNNIPGRTDAGTSCKLLSIDVP